MKVICDRGALVESLNLVAGVVVARTPKPALRCVYASAKDDALTLSATDTEVSIRISTPRVEVQDAGDALIPADKLQQIMRESIDPTLTLATKDETTTIKGADSTFKLLGYPSSDFPEMPDFPADADFELPAGDLHKLIAQTLFATARENSRYAINGVLLERHNKDLTVVATDGHRLAMAKGKCKSLQDADRNAIIPTKALNLLLRLFDDAEQTVKVKVTESQVLFATDTAVLASNLVEGNFPPYKDVVPKDGDKKATLPTDVFISAVRRAGLLTNEESKGVRMAFDQAGLTITSRAPEMGEAEIKVEMPEYTGEPVEIGFNPAYLLDALKVIDENQVFLDLKAGNKPGVLRTGPNFLYVVMPVNLQ